MSGILNFDPLPLLYCILFSNLFSFSPLHNFLKNCISIFFPSLISLLIIINYILIFLSSFMFIHIILHFMYFISVHIVQV